MASNPELERLRAEVAKRKKAVNDKVSRVRRNTGISLTGSSYDPRRNPKAVSRYNVRQLRSYLNDLNSFTDRRNQFGRGAGGELISQARFREYKQLETRFNRIGAAEENRLRGVKDPIVNVSLDKRRATYAPDRQRAQGEMVNRPYGLRNVEIGNINGPAALEKMIASMKNKLRPGYLPEQLKKGRANLEAMLNILGDIPMQLDGKTVSAVEFARNLTDDQFDILWNYANAAGAISPYYASMLDGKVGENTNNDVVSLLDWASKLPNTRSARSR